jgi:hypothetical protein
MDNKILSSFYRELADLIDNDQIDQDGIKELGDFYMSYNFYNNIGEQNIEEKEFKKFLVLGWYIYSMILTNDDIDNQIEY